MKGAKKNSQYLGIAFFLGVAGMILIYGLLAAPFYLYLIKRDIAYAYREISRLDLANIDEEDEEILQNFQAEGLEFLITDLDFKQIYATWNRSAEQRIESNIKGHVEEYQEQPVPDVRSYHGVQIIRLRGLTRQGKESYYIYIREEIRAVTEMIRYTLIYFCGAALLGALVFYVFWKKSTPGSQDGELQEKEMTAAQSGQLFEAQKEFVANISHELKTPLAVISGQVEMLQYAGNEIDRNYYFSSIREEIDKMSGLVGDLLDITILEHNIGQMECSPVDVTDMMDYMLLKYDALFQKNKIKVSAEIAKNCSVLGNRMYLEQAVNNYMMNAFQHTAQGKRIRISLTMEGKNARIGIYNEGASIPPKEIEQIWQSYYMNPRGKQKTETAGNAGLGLYTVKKIVEQHHGACGVENQEKGVEFWIRLPLAK